MLEYRGNTQTGDSRRRREATVRECWCNVLNNCPCSRNVRPSSLISVCPPINLPFVPSEKSAGLITSDITSPGLSMHLYLTQSSVQIKFRPHICLLQGLKKSLCRVSTMSDKLSFTKVCSYLSSLAVTYSCKKSSSGQLQSKLSLLSRLGTAVPSIRISLPCYQRFLALTLSSSCTRLHTQPSW